MSTDLLQEKYPNKTPYHYCSQNPVNLVDPDGLDDYYKENGEFLGSDKQKTDFVHIVNNDVIGDSDGNYVILDDDILYQLTDKNGNAISGETFKYMASVLYAEGGYGASQKERNKYSDPTANKSHKQNANRGVILGYSSTEDYSKGAYWWDGKDFNGKNKIRGGYLERYVPGYRFTESSHDLWKQGDNLKSGVGQMKRTYNYKYESIHAAGNTTFSRLTESYKNSLFINKDGTIRDSNWSGQKPL